MTAPVQAAEVVGHRGARGDRPENTLPAFQYALDRGVGAVEADVGVTRDGRVVVTHDRRVSATTCTGPGTGRLVRSLTFAALQRLDCGSPGGPFAGTRLAVPGAHMPALAQLLRLARPGRARVVVELKRDPRVPRETVPRAAFARAVVRDLRRARMLRRVTVQSFDWGLLRAVGRLEPRVRRVALVGRGTLRQPWLGGVRYGGSLTGALRRAGFAGASVQHRLVTPELVRAMHARGLAVTAYTVNDPARRAALVALGVDAVVTDYVG